MQLTLWAFLNSGFNFWLADNKSLAVLKRGDGLLDVDWPPLGLPLEVHDMNWVTSNLNLDLTGLARRTSTTA